MAIVMTGQGTARVGDYQISATLANTDAPIHFSLTAAILGVSQVFAGQVGTFQSGDVVVSVTKNS